MTTIIETSDAEHLRMVLPVLVSYIENIDGADLGRLKQAALRDKQVPELAVINALIAASSAVRCLDYGGPFDEVNHDPHVSVIVLKALNRATRERAADVNPTVRPGDLADAVLDDLAKHGYAITYVGAAPASADTSEGS